MTDISHFQKSSIVNQMLKMNGHNNSNSETSSTTSATVIPKQSNQQPSELNYCEVYFGMPSSLSATAKRKTYQNQDNPMSQQPHPQPHPHQIKSILTNNNSGTTNNKVNHDNPIMQFSSSTASNNANMMIGCELDNLDVCSHYSLDHHVNGTNNNLITSSNSNIPQQTATQHNMYNVKFSSNSNFVRHYPASVAASMSVTPTPSIRGSLKRSSKGRSNQSLCSCDVGDDVDILSASDPNRPLYQYSLDRKNKIHTYTCEQNAQILMRLERERKTNCNSNSKNSGSATNAAGSNCNKKDAKGTTFYRKRSLSLFEKKSKDTKDSKDINHTINLMMNSSCDDSYFDYKDTNFMNGSTETETDLSDSIPPPPPPVSLNKKQQLKMMQQDCLKGFTDNTLELQSMLDDCTTTILNCANNVADHFMNTSTNSTTTESTESSSSPNNILVENKPDVLCRHDDMIHSQRRNNKLKTKSSSAAMTSSNYFNQTLLSQQNFDNQIPTHHHNHHNYQMGKYNTIGPSNVHNFQYNQRQQQQLKQKHQQNHHSPQNQQRLEPPPCNNLTNARRYFSQSLTNFPFNYGTLMGKDKQLKKASHDHSEDHDCYHQQHHQYRPHHQNTKQANYLQGDLSTTGFHVTDIIGSHDDRHYHIHQPQKQHPQLMKQNQIDKENSYRQFLAQSDSLHNTSNSCGSIGMGIGVSGINLLNSSSFTNLDTMSNCSRSGGYYTNATTNACGKLKSALKSKTQIQEQIQLNEQLQHKQFHSSTTSSLMPWKHRQCPSRGSSSSGTNSLPRQGTQPGENPFSFKINTIDKLINKSSSFSTDFDAAKHWLAVSSILLIIGAAGVAVPLALRVAASAPFEERLRVATQLLDQVPLIDGHNDLPWNIRKFLHNKMNDFNFDQDLSHVLPWAKSQWSHTDLPRLKKGRVSAQFWAAYVPCEAQYRDAVQVTLEQIDIIKRLTERYSPQLTTCTSASDIVDAHKNNRLCSLTGVEGGHSLGGSLAVLRTLYGIGVRYVTLTSTCHTPWADSSYADAPTYNVKHGGLTAFGKATQPKIYDINLQCIALLM
ncbi:hypothetical protein ACFFRR_003719 [Megaselia abdita]